MCAKVVNKKGSALNISDYTDVLDAIRIKSDNFKETLKKSQQTLGFNGTIEPSTNKIEYYTNDGLQTIAIADFVLIAKIKNTIDKKGRKLTMWRWGHTLKNWCTNYKEIANVLPLLPEEFSDFRNASAMEIPQILGEIITAIIANKMSLEYVEYRNRIR